MTDSTPGWQPDPSGKHDHRYWDGSQWTDNVSDGGVASTDPYVAGDVTGDAGGDQDDDPRSAHDNAYEVGNTARHAKDRPRGGDAQSGGSRAAHQRQGRE